jgi:hypothetical protein
MIKVRSKKTGITAEWSERTFELNKRGMENGTIPFELISKEENIPTPLAIEDFLKQSEKKKVAPVVVEDKVETPVVDEKEVVAISYEDMTVKELRKILQVRGETKVFTNKANLIKMIEDDNSK